MLISSTWLLLIAIGTLAAVWARLGSNWRARPGRAALVLLRSLFLSGIALIVGALPWYYAEKSSEVTGGGAPFVFLVWIGLGPALSFGVLPAAYAFTARLNLSPVMKWLGAPTLFITPVALLAAVAFLQGLGSGEAKFEGADVLQLAMFAILLAASAVACWCLYVFGMELGRTSRAESTVER